jgi:hypothetical protein
MLVAGCGSNTEKSFHLPATTSRDALTGALDTWKAGREKPGLLDEFEPGLQVADPSWTDGKKLQSYEIIGEEQIPDGPQKFTVKLTLTDVAEPQTVTYVVLGKDPIWIMREEEYSRPSGM